MKLSEGKMKELEQHIRTKSMDDYYSWSSIAQAAVDFLSAEWTREPAVSAEDEIRELADLAYERLTGTQPELQRLREENEALNKEANQAAVTIGQHEGLIDRLKKQHDNLIANLRSAEQEAALYRQSEANAIDHGKNLSGRVEDLKDENERLKADLEAARASKPDVAAIVAAAVEQYATEHRALETRIFHLRAFANSLTPKPSLKPCPMGCRTQYQPDYLLDEKWCVHCPECGMRGPEGETKDESHNAWNAMPRTE